MMKHPSRRSDLAFGCGGCVAAALAAVGLHLWLKSTYIMDNSPHDRSTYIPFTWENILGLSLFITCATMAVAAFFIFVSATLHKALAASQDTASTNAVSVMASSLTTPTGPVHGTSGFTVLANEAATAGLLRGTVISPSTQLRIAAAIYAGYATTLFVLGVIAAAAWAYDPLFTCAVLLCVGEPARFDVPPDRPVNGLSFNATLGMMVFFTFVPMSLVMMGRLLTLRTVFPSHRRSVRLPWATSAEEPPRAGMARQPRGALLFTSWKRSLLLGILPAAGFLVLFAPLTFYLPNDTRRFIARRIATLAMMQASYGTNSGNVTAPELPHAWFRTRNLVLSEFLTLKLFPGNVFFYVYLLLLMFTMWLLRLSVLGRTWLRSPVRWRPMPGWNCGDLLLSVITALFTLLFFWYWVHDHNFKRFWSESQGRDATGFIQVSERWGRATGQLATLFLSLLMVPASRSSSLPLFRAMGLTWESFLWAHRVLGYAMLLATLAHVVFFLVNFYVNGVLWHNLTTLPTLVGKKKVRNDFTILPVTWATLLMFLSMGVFAYHPLRRRFFELFYYSHLVGSCVLLPAVLWHASSGWEYLMPGVTLWLLDRFLRMYRSGAPVELLGCAVVDGQTLRIDFQCVAGGADVQPGQFVFLNVPEVSLLQWHPFTTLATSAVEGDARGDGGGGRLTVFVKTMGSAESWTGRLHRRVAAAEAENHASAAREDTASRDGAVAWRTPTFTLRVDGPCGSPLDATDFSDYHTVHFVAGGIGVVPCAALFHALRDQHARMHEAPHPRRHGQTRYPSVVKLTWVCRSLELVSSFASVLGDGAEVAQAGTTVFERAIFITGQASAWEASPTSSPTVAAATRHRQATPDKIGAKDALSFPSCSTAAPQPSWPQQQQQPEQQSSAKDREAASPVVASHSDSTPAKGHSGVNAATDKSPSREDSGGGLGTAPAHSWLPLSAVLSGPATRPVTHRCGRPNWLNEFAAAASAFDAAARRREARMLVFACGPSKLTREVRAVAEGIGAAFHREEFHL